MNSYPATILSPKTLIPVGLMMTIFAGILAYSLRIENRLVFLESEVNHTEEKMHDRTVRIQYLETQVQHNREVLIQLEEINRRIENIEENIK